MNETRLRAGLGQDFAAGLDDSFDSASLADSAGSTDSGNPADSGNPG